MKVVIVYSSRFGNGKKCVDCVDAALKAKGHDVSVLNAPSSDPAQIPLADMYIISGATEAFRIARGIRVYLKGLPVMECKKYALINTHAAKNPWALPKMTKILSKKKKMVKVSEIDFRVGEGSQQGNGLPQDYQVQLTGWVDRLG
jgi:menaquinone-dependent protoporphyrinogen IX oxidase